MSGFAFSSSMALSDQLDAYYKHTANTRYIYIRMLKSGIHVGMGVGFGIYVFVSMGMGSSILYCINISSSATAV